GQHRIKRIKGTVTKAMNDSILRQNLVEFLRGGQAHVAPEQALNGLNPALRNARPATGGHSVWEEFEHMRLAQEDILRYTVDASWTSPPFPDGYWPKETEQLTEEAWMASVAAFFADLEEVIKLVEDASVDLTAEISHGEGGHTYLREILLVADHNAYHLGQIVQTRKTLGDWPKPGF
ncbi:MAG: DinB family protein, partial [Acidobacteriota bacterium]